MADSEYHKGQEGNVTVFEVTPATAPKQQILIVMGVIIGVIGFLFYFVFAPAGIFFFCICGAMIWAGSKDWRPRAHKSKATFRVTPSAIETSGRTFNKKDIHRLIVRRDETVHYSLYFGIDHVLDLEAGGKAYTLASGMDETTAFGLLKDVRNVIGVETWS
jgi:hypothetical protein